MVHIFVDFRGIPRPLPVSEGRGRGGDIFWRSPKVGDGAGTEFRCKAGTGRGGDSKMAAGEGRGQNF